MGAFHSPSELCYITCRVFVVFGCLAVLLFGCSFSRQFLYHMAVLQFGCTFRRQFLYRMAVSARDPSLNVNVEIY